MERHLEEVSLHLERFKDACSSKNYSTCREVLSRLKDIIDEKEAQEGLTLPQTHDGIEENEHVEEPQDFDNNEQQQIGDQLDFDNNEQQQMGDQLLHQQFFDGIPEENDLEDHQDFSKIPLDEGYLKEHPWGYFTTEKTSEELRKNEQQKLGGAKAQQKLGEAKAQQLGGAKAQQKRGGAKAQQKRGGAKVQQQLGGENAQQQLNEEPVRRSERRFTPTKRLLKSLAQRDSEEEEE